MPGDWRVTLKTSFFDGCVQWLLSVEGRRRAARILRQYRLPIEPDDVVQTALEKLLQANKRQPGRFDGDEFATSVPAAYCTTIMRNLLEDAQKGRFDMPFDPFDERFRDDDVDQMLDDGQQDVYDRAERETDLLRGFAEQAAVRADILSAIFTILALLRDPEADCGDVPLPAKGATPEELRLLKAMWLAGHHEFFNPDGSPPSAAQKKARSRWGQLVKKAWQDIIAVMEQYLDDPEEDR